MKQWIIDKWWWLKTFNKPPQIVIDADILVFLTEGGRHAITSLGRIDIVINGDLITFSKEKQEWLLKEAKEMEKQQSFVDVNRVEVIQHSAPYNGRAYTNYNAKDVELQLQDNNKTLKIFLK
jgi:hypothetical protein